MRILFCCYNLRLICASMRATRNSIASHERPPVDKLYAATTTANFHPLLYSYLLRTQLIQHLVEWVGSCSPVGEEQAQSDGLEDAGDDTNGDCIQRSLLGDNLCNDTWSS